MRRMSNGSGRHTKAPENEGSTSGRLVKAIVPALFLGMAFVAVNVMGKTRYLAAELRSSSDTSSRKTALISIPSENQANPNATTCQTIDFPKRDANEEGPLLEQWDQAHQFVISRHLTFLKNATLEMHRDLILEIEREGIPGMMVECGVAKAGSSVTFASVKNPNRCLHLFDTFEGMPQPSVKDGEDVHKRYEQIQVDKQKCKDGLPDCNKWYYGNMDDLMGFDMRQMQAAGFDLEQHNIHFHKGLFDDTVWPNVPVAYAHLDGDWYESVMHMLQRISPYLAEGGYFVLDDVFYYSGATAAFVEYFGLDQEWLMEELYERKGQCLTAVNEMYFIVGVSQKAYAKRISLRQIQSGTIPKCKKATVASKE